MNELPSAVADAVEWRPVESVIEPCVTSMSQALPGARLAIYSDLASVEAIWREFEPRAACTVFQNFDYLAAWQKHIGSRERVTPAVVVVESSGSTQAIFPFAIHDRGSCPRLSWLAQDLCDYLTPLISSQFACIGAEKFGASCRHRRLFALADRSRRRQISIRPRPSVSSENAMPNSQGNPPRSSCFILC
jgi:CelD/BcsL family acetyltransferase involved in cellulose biosynthesis